MQIGDTLFRDRSLFLAPMEDVTDASFRYICKEFGADMVYTEFISSDGLIRDAKKSFQKLNIEAEEFPIGIQIYGHIIEAMVEAALIAQRANPSVIDINFGCPVSKIATRGAGSGIFQDIPKMIEMTRQIVKAVKIPVTVKTRLGWDDNSKVIVDVAERLQDVGISALTIHGRTRCQLYKGDADWSLIGDVKNNPYMKIPIIGNGDITSPEKALEAFNRYGVDAIMIGRATYGHPWIFKEIRYYLDNGIPMPPLTVTEKVELARKHLTKSIQVKGERVGVLEMRRHLSNYFKALPNFKETRIKLVTLEDIPLLYSTLDSIIDTWGDFTE